MQKIMIALSRWNPFKEMEDLHRRMGSLFHLPLHRGDGRESITVSEWAPVVDIIEDEKGYLIKADLPEVNKADVKVTVENGVLTITGERKFEKEEKGKRYHRIERSYGSFERSFTLPDDADPNSVKAEFKEGLLRVNLGKSEHAKPKLVDVKID
jgi:HSP20 family protein